MFQYILGENINRTCRGGGGWCCCCWWFLLHCCYRCCCWGGWKLSWRSDGHWYIQVIIIIIINIWWMEKTFHVWFIAHCKNRTGSQWSSSSYRYWYVSFHLAPGTPASTALMIPREEQAFAVRVLTHKKRWCNRVNAFSCHRWRLLCYY